MRWPGSQHANEKDLRPRKVYHGEVLKEMLINRAASTKRWNTRLIWKAGLWSKISKAPFVIWPLWHQTLTFMTMAVIRLSMPTKFSDFIHLTCVLQKWCGSNLSHICADLYLRRFGWTHLHCSHNHLLRHKAISWGYNDYSGI